jgi:hypothetical protein
MESAWSLKIATLVASTLLASVLPTLVQTAQASTPTNGTTEVINIGAGQTVQRSFNATQGNLIVYGLGNTVVANDYLQYRIYDATGKGVGDCKYTCPLYQHKIVARSFLPPSTGTYFMVLNFNNPKTTGAVKLSILDAIQNPPQVLSGMRVENFQTSDVAKIFRITATQGNLIVYGLGNTVDANDYLQYRIYDSTGQAVGDCQYTCPLYQNKTVARSFSPPSTGTYFLVLNFNNPKTTGAVKLSFPESSEASIVPSASASPVTPTPKATSASPSPTPTKTTSAKATSASSSSQTTANELRICPKYVFLGMRGSGQKLQPGSDVGVFGPELASLLSELKKIPALVGNLESNYPDAASYKALEVGLNEEYVNEVRNVAPIALTKLFSSYIDRCESDTKFILAGYSQGAYAVHWLVTFLEKPSTPPQFKNRILAAITLANPGNPKTGLMAYLEALKGSPVGKDAHKVGFLCAWAAEVTKKNCEKFWGLLAKNAVDDVLPPPKAIPMFSYYKKQDLVADIGSNISFKLLLKTPPNFYSAVLPAAFAFSISMTKTHSSYCPKSGPFSKPPTDKCSDSNNADFVQKATKHVIDQLTKKK